MPIIPQGQLPIKVRDVLLATLSAVANDRDTWDPVGAELVVISPWISDVPLPALAESPFSAEIPTNLMPGDSKLSLVLRALLRAGGRVQLATLAEAEKEWGLGKSQKELEREAGFLKDLKNLGGNVLVVKGLHAKVIATKRASIIGSANITFNGLYKSRELAFLITSHPSEIDISALIKYFPVLLDGALPWQPPSNFKI